MESWSPLRDCIQDHEFVQDAVSLGISQQDLDEHVRAQLEQVLCGATLEAVDAVYPILVGPDFRMAMTTNSVGVPALRVAFRITDRYLQLCRCAKR